MIELFLIGFLIGSLIVLFFDSSKKEKEGKEEDD